MIENEPVAATAAVAVVAEGEDPMRPGHTYYVNPNGVLTEVPPTPPAPTWRRANRGEIAMWFGLGAATLVVAEIVAAAAIAIGWAV